MEKDCRQTRDTVLPYRTNILHEYIIKLGIKIPFVMKRTLDFLVSLFLIIVTSPLFLILYICTFLSSRGPVIYKQERIGKGGKPFIIYKFRTMVNDAEASGVPQLAEIGDDRLTRFGSFMRAHHLDELPQLWNVLKGDMSFIGYRPERKYFIDKIMERDPRYEQLYKIRPGVTSYATLYNGYTDTMEKMLKRLEYDLYYLDHMSLGMDIKILWKTFISIVFGKKF